MADEDPQVVQPEGVIQAASDRAERLLDVITQRIGAAQQPVAGKLFPHGINEISLKVNAGPNIGVEIKILGPERAGAAAAAAAVDEAAAA
ncbi:MAG TPA: hypothetical protein VFS20_08990 [Longimicrobium sp.]|nr:hypothetical protein [Longimicrobium sp.]